MFRSSLVLIGAVCLLQFIKGTEAAAPASMAWAQTLDNSPKMYGLSTCLDIDAITVYEENTFINSMLDAHIYERNLYNKAVEDEGCPEHRIEPSLVWNNGLAKVAQLWANMCSTGHGYTGVRCDFTDGSSWYDDFNQNSFWWFINHDDASDFMGALAGPVSFWSSTAKYMNVCSLECNHNDEGTCETYKNMVDPDVHSIGCAYTDPCHKCTEWYKQTDVTFEKERDLSYATAFYVCVYDA